MTIICTHDNREFCSTIGPCYEWTKVESEALSDSVATNPKIEDRQVMETINTGTPGVFTVHGEHGRHRGLEGKDAAFLTELHSATRSQALDSAIHSNGKDAVIQSLGAKYDNALQTLETKFQMERAIKESELAGERLAREQLAQLQSVRAELALMIQSEADKTRDLIRFQDSKTKDGELLLLKIKDLLPVTP